MLLITFHIGKERYAIQANSIVEIIPMVNLNKLPLTENYVAGVFNYRGNPTPVIDLCKLYTDSPCKEMMSTRIMMIEFKMDSGEQHILGLIAEKTTESINMNLNDFETTGINIDRAPFLRGITNDEYGLVQLVDTNLILPGDVLGKLFLTADESLKAISG